VTAATALRSSAVPSCRRALNDRNGPGDPPGDPVSRDELQQICRGRLASAGPPPFRHDQQLGCHEGQILIGLVPVRPAAEVDLCHRVQAMAIDRVNQGGEFDSVAYRDVRSSFRAGMMTLMLTPSRRFAASS
jgi:hypothetical protein